MSDPKKKSWHDLSDPVTVASVLVRDHLDTVIYRHGKVKGDAVSAAVMQLVTALLEHLPGEAKQLRAQRISNGADSAEILSSESGKAHAGARKSL